MSDAEMTCAGQRSRSQWDDIHYNSGTCNSHNNRDMDTILVPKCQEFDFLQVCNWVELSKLSS